MALFTFVAVVAAYMGGVGVGRNKRPGLVAVAVAGLLGSIVDSVLGAGLQARYRCLACGASLEVARHGVCASRAERVSGVPGLDNDAVNLLATVTGAAVALLICNAM